MKRLLFVAFVTVSLAPSVLARADAVDDIKKAGRAFGEAMAKGDSATAKKHAITSEAGSRVIDDVGAYRASREKLGKAATEKFGDEGKNLFPDRAPQQPQLNLESKYDDANIEVKGDKAVVTSKQGEHRELARFQKQGGDWKVDLTNNQNLERAERSLPVLEKMTGVFNETATEVKDGKYKTASEAKTALRLKMASMFRGGAPGRRGGPGGGA